MIPDFATVDSIVHDCNERIMHGIFPTCGGAVAPTYDGTCPSGQVCGRSGGACGCIESLDDGAFGIDAGIAFCRHDNGQGSIGVPAQIKIPEHAVTAGEQRRDGDPPGALAAAPAEPRGLAAQREYLGAAAAAPGDPPAQREVP